MPKKYSIIIGKLALSALILTLIFTRADVEEMWAYVRRADIGLLICAMIVLNIGQIASALRMRYYFSASTLWLQHIESIALYYMGAILNHVLPGGVSGDGYIAYYVQRYHQFSWKTAIRLLISGRGSGLLFLVVNGLAFLLLSDRVMNLPYAGLLVVIGLMVVFPSYSLLAKYLLKEPIHTQLGAAVYSFVVQGMVALTVVFLLLSTGHAEYTVEYLAIFMLATVVSIIPISFGGVGLREGTFFVVAPWLGLDPELGVVVALLYYIVNLLTALLGGGIFWLWKKQSNIPKAE